MDSFKSDNIFLSNVTAKRNKSLTRRNDGFKFSNVLLRSVDCQNDTISLRRKNDNQPEKLLGNFHHVKKSDGEHKELVQEEEVTISNCRSSNPCNRERDSSTCSQECPIESKQRKRATRSQNPKKQRKPRNICIASPDLLPKSKSYVMKKSAARRWNDAEEWKNENLFKYYGKVKDYSKTLDGMEANSLAENQAIHELPCGESGKWKYIRMYQERARKREARLKRKRQKEREEGKKSSGRKTKSTRRRGKSKRRSKSRGRRSSKARKSRSKRKRSRSKSKRSRSKSKRSRSKSKRSRRRSLKSRSRRSTKPRSRRN